MTIKAILRNGSIQPLEPLLSDWAEGKEPLVEDSTFAAAEDLEAWTREIDEAARQLPAQDHERFREALDDVERQSKEATRREWGIP
jgi:uncharacterized membrane protein